MKRALEERKPRCEGRRHDWVIKGLQNRLARAFAFEEEDDLGFREEDLPAIDCLRDDRLDPVIEELRCSLALAGLEAGYQHDPFVCTHVAQSRQLSSTSSVAPVALLLLRVAVVVVPLRLPEARLSPRCFARLDVDGECDRLQLRHRRPLDKRM
jgi:hypothetical protein